MKRFIRAAVANEVKIYIDLSYIHDDQVVRIAANTESPELDGIESQNFDEFVTNVYSTLCFCGYEVDDYEVSDRLNSVSSYLTAHKKQDEIDGDIKVIIFIRLSDHKLDKMRSKDRNKYYDEKAQSLKFPETKVRQKWKLYDIVVDGTTYQSYDEALDALEKKLYHI